jgi:hypothetical protein
VAERPDDDATKVDRRRKDRFLGRIVLLTEKGELSDMPVTLWVGGVLVSGLIVGAKAYIEGMATVWEETGSLGLAEGFRAAAAELPDLDPDAEHPDEELPDEELPRFIHLREARTFAPSGLGKSIPATGGVWWRGHLSSVDGWSFGQLAEGPPPEEAAP